MFDIGWSELVVIGVVALIVIGPKELPGVLRMVGQWVGKIRRMASDFQGQFQEAMREAEMADLKKQVDEITDSARNLTSDINPVKSIEDSFEDPFGDTSVADAEATHAALDEHAAPAPAEPASTPEPTETPAQPASSPRPDDHAPTDTKAEPEPPPKTAAGGPPA